MEWMAAIKVSEFDPGTSPFTDTSSSRMSIIDTVNEIKLTNIVEEDEHLKLIVQQDVIFREGGKNFRNNSTHYAAAKSNSRTQEISMAHVCLRYISAFANFERKVKPISLFKYDKYSIIAIFKLEITLRRVIDKSIDAKSRSAEGLRLGTTVATLGDVLGLEKQIMADM